MELFDRSLFKHSRNIHGRHRKRMALLRGLNSGPSGTGKDFAASIHAAFAMLEIKWLKSSLHTSQF